MADADGWNGPRGNDEGGFGRLLNELRAIKEGLAAANRGAPLRAAGISVDEGGMTIDRSLSVIGDIWFNYLGSAENPGRFNAYVGGSGRAVLRLTPPYTGSLDDTALYLEGPSTGAPDGHVVLTSGGQAAVDAEQALFLRSNQDAVTVTAATNLFLLSDGTSQVTAQEWVFVTGDDGFSFRKSGAGDTWAVEVFSAGDSLTLRGTDGFRLRDGDDATPTSSAAHALYTAGNDQVYRAPTRHYFAGNLYTTGDLSCGGTKPFIIDHPLRDDKSLVHVATESPVAAIEYPWPEPVTLDENGEAELELPDYFEALAADDYRAVWVQPVGRPFPTGADLVVDGRTTVYGEAGRQVFVKVSARRGDDAGQFDVEIPRIQPPSEETP